MSTPTNNHPQVLGITGGIGSGKSVVSRCLRIMGIPVYDCDREAKRLNETHPEIRKGLLRLVGQEVYQPDGTLDKKVLADYLFADSSHAARVNSIVHPVVKADFLSWANRQGSPWVGMESAILHETAFDGLTHKILTVCAPEALRLHRAMQRDGATEAAVRRRMAQQLPEEEKARLSDFTILNDGQIPLIPQILDILANLLCKFHS